MKDTVTVIGWISKGIFRGQIELPKENKFSVLLFSGETEADWVNVSLADILSVTALIGIPQLCEYCS